VAQVSSTTLSSPYLLLSLVESLLVASVNNIDSKYQEKTILNKELSQDNKAPTDTKPQQQSSTLEISRKPQNKPSAKSNNQTPNKKDGGVVIYKVGTDNILPSMVASSPMPLTCPIILTL
jgi:hypothetical protein